MNEQLSIGDVMEYYKETLKTIITSSIDTNSEKKQTDFMSLDYEQNMPITANEKINDIKTDPETIKKEQLIREMFPDFGDGFVYKCLEHYNFDNERVLDAILENNLPPHLDSLNRQIKKSDLNVVPKANQNQKDKYDPTLTKDLDLVEIYQGKKDKISYITNDKQTIKNKTIELVAKIDSEEKESKEKIKTMIERGKLNKNDIETNFDYMGLYEDEFDDTYENEDATFDQDDVLFDDPEEETETEENPQSSETTNSNTLLFSSRQTQEKFDNSSRYSRKQFHNKRNYNRKFNQQGDLGRVTNKNSHQNSGQSLNQSSINQSTTNPNVQKNYQSSKQNNSMQTENKPLEIRPSKSNLNISGKGNFYRNIQENSNNNRGGQKNQKNRSSYNNYNQSKHH